MATTPRPSPLQKRPPVLADLQCFLKPELWGRGHPCEGNEEQWAKPSVLAKTGSYIPKHFTAMCLSGVLILTATSRAVSALEIK